MKYHITKRGEPGICRAHKGACPLGNSSEHFDSKEEARGAFELRAKKSNFLTIQAYEEKMEAYEIGSPSAVTGNLKDFMDESFEHLAPNSSILELGSGTGRDAEYLSSKGFNVIPSDAATSFVSALKNRGLEAVKLNALEDDFPKVDAVFANAVFLHFNNDEMAVALKRSFAALPDGGSLVFTVKEGDDDDWSSEKLDTPRYFNYWREQDLSLALNRAGFSESSISKDNAGNVTWLQVKAIKRNKS